METPESCYRRADDMVTRCIAGETIIVPVRGHVGDLDSIYTLNEVGTRIWQHLDGRTSVEEIVGRIRDEFEVELEEAARDVRQFLTTLEAAGLIRLQTA